MKTEPLAIFEMSLLTKAGMAVCDAYEVILSHYKDDTEVASLFTDLVADWDSNFSVKMVEPFMRRASNDADYKFSLEFVKRGALTGMVEAEWSLLAYGLLLKEKVIRRGVSPEDVLLGRFILSSCQDGGATEAEMLTWSSDPSWEDIVSRGVDTFPEEWWSSLNVSPEFQELPSLPEIEKALSDAGVPERIADIQTAWNLYASAHLTLKT